MEGSGLGISQLTRRLQHLEESVSLNYHVQWIVGFRKVALRENDLVGDGSRAQSQLQSGGDDGVLGGGRTGLDQVLIQKILKLRAPGFESRGVAFAMLFAIFSTLVCCAFMPLAALKSARIIDHFPSGH